jgi:tRNA modification GTPase
MRASDTIAALATAPGRAAVSVVRASGSLVSEIMAQAVERPLPPRRAVFTRFVDRAGAPLDNGIAIFFPGPASYTGEDVLEMQGHGGPVVAGMLLERCMELGARLAEPGEFTRRAYLNGKLDLAQAESVIDLINASTSDAARSALRSLNGEFSTRIQALSVQLRELRVLVEAGLDFPEEDIGTIHREDEERRLQQAETALESILGASQQGSLLREGVHLVLAGAPNVGKSSLLNRLAGQELAIVTDFPGTTRDAIRESINLRGVPFHIVDTAGLREAHDPVEALGIERTWAAVQSADIILWVTDAAKAGMAAPELLARMPSDVPRVHVINKIDLVSEAPRIVRDAAEITVWLSARTGAGVELLQQALLQQAGWRNTGEGALLARARHLQALHAARGHLRHARDVVFRAELFAEELRLAHDALGGIVGRGSSDDLLGEIFSRFCIGK